MATFKILKASAGSGKTFSLSREYLRLLLIKPFHFRHILAVTFTNKAKEEMKSRILEELYILATTPQKSKHFDYLMNYFHFDEPEKLKRLSERNLQHILNDYSRFAIGTIDEFFQRVTRGFIKELGLNADYQIELDTSGVLDEAIDLLLNKLDHDPELLDWLTLLAENNIEEGRKWDIHEDIKKLGNELFKEHIREQEQNIYQHLKDRGNIKKYRELLSSYLSSFENYMDQKGREGIRLIEEHGLQVADFKYGKSGFANYFYKILKERKDYDPKQRGAAAINNLDAWITKKSSQEIKDQVEACYSNGLNMVLEQAVAYYHQHISAYQTTRLINAHIYALGILSDLSEEIRKYTDEQNILLLSDASQLIYVLVKNNDAPFIYEKTGHFYHHFMIDEFQDTSHMQWANFKPLIENSLSEGNDNLLVGDVKQSIYRWRNSDWEILGGKLQEEMNRFSPYTISLENNWRSLGNIIDFNNALFGSAPATLDQIFRADAADDEVMDTYSQKISEAYEHVHQRCPQDEKQSTGYVKVAFHAKKEEINFNQEAIEASIRDIELLQEKGIEPKDIAFLVRDKKDGQLIADALLEKKASQADNKYKYDIVSEEMLYISGSPTIKFIIALMRHMINPGEKINQAHLRHEYMRYLKQDDHNDPDSIFSWQETNDLFSLLDIPPSQEKTNLSLHNIPLIEIPERIISYFNLARNPIEITYIEAFQSMILEYAGNHPTDIHSFIEWWDQYGVNKSLSVDQNQKALSIITIHKSKGLQYKAIVVPFCRWELDHRHNQPIIWCQNQAPFDLFGEVPVKYQKRMMESYFRQNYLEERMKAHVDNLNLLYVAFTRAEEVLIAHAPLPGKNDHNIADLIYRTIELQEQFTPNPELSLQSGLSQKEDDEIYELGEIPLQQKNADEHQDKDDQEIKTIEYYCTPAPHKLKLKNEHIDILTDIKPGEKVNYGTLMHQLFQQIETEKDLPAAVLAMYHEGLISASQRDEIKRDLSARISQPKIKEWFSGKWSTMLERDILLPSGKVYRPDRVLTKDDQLMVIDYKFGERLLDQHQQQMITYLDVLKRMGYQNMNGYIWYVEQNEVIEV